MTSFRTASLFVLGATVLAALAVRHWPARQEEEPPTVPSPALVIAHRGAGGEQESSPPTPDQGVQRAIVAEHVEAGVQPAPAASDDAVVVSWNDAYMSRSLDELRALDRTIRTPRLFVPGCLNLPPAAFVCRGDWALLTEDVDPQWSHATEERLRAIWKKSVPEFSSEFLFVMCKTTLCQINYRFAQGTEDDAGRRSFGRFRQGLRMSDLASELHWVCEIYGGMIVAAEYERNFPPSGTQPLQRDRTQCRTMRRLDKRGP